MGEEFEFELDWLKKWALYSPDSVSFKDADSRAEYSYAALYYLANKLSSHLTDRFGIKSGDRVAVLATNELEYIPLFFAIQRLGAIMVPVNFRLTGREITHIMKDSSPSLLVLQAQFQSVTAQVDPLFLPSKRWVFDESGESLRDFLAAELKVYSSSSLATEIRQERKSWEKAFAGKVDQPAMILYTSGTTGSPKGAIITNKMLHWNSVNTTLRLNLSQNDVSLSFLPFFHTGGWNVLLTPFVHRGARTVIMKKFEARQVLDLCEKERVTILFGVPTTMDMMARTSDFKERNLSSVRYAIVGGEPMPLELIRTWSNKGVPVRQGYGLTEFGPNVFSLNEEDAIRKIGSIGFPNFYIEARIVDNEGHDVPTGEIGELILKGPVCTPGYWNHPEATADTIRNGWLHTGDLVRKDEAGFHFVVGRKKDMFISGGENVYPIEVEQYLGSHPAIQEVAVIGVPDTKWGEVGKAFVALKTGKHLSADELLAYCAGNLAKYKIPKHIAFVSELPKGDSGKILKRKLRELES